jgi:starch synthase (maltosyl-transferring)
MPRQTTGRSRSPRLRAAATRPELDAGAKRSRSERETPVALPVEGRRRAVVERLYPSVDGGAFPAKRTLGDRVVVEADVFADGHDLVACRLLHRPLGASGFAEAPMTALGNDRWRGELVADRLGRHELTVEGWVDHFLSWRRDLEKRDLAGQATDVDLRIGAELVRQGAARAAGHDAQALGDAAERLEGPQGVADGDLAARVALALSPELRARMERWPDRSLATRWDPPLPLVVDPVAARFSAWYELFPRSTAAERGRDGEPRHGTFRDVAARLDYVAGMGFDVLYLPPIHPIGATHRKGRNNARVAARGDVGSPWAIGGREGGHTAVHPALGTLEDFHALVAAAERRGIRIALDLAFQCSPDHPWVHEHPEWFRRRPDGTIQHAENPPKKYEDIVPFDFETPAWRELWQALKGVVDHWAAHGVTMFRVDNPHTKAFPFWEWMIAAVRAERPDVFFLAEAFTRPRPLYRLAKLGFSQSYNYFPWRTGKRELTDWMREITSGEVAELFRANLWPNTPDILTEQLQHGGRAAFVQRLVLAATLGASYGIYGPPFELMESEPREAGSEEYRDSEKYELRHWDLGNRPSLAELIGRVNRIRRENPPLQHDRNLAFHTIDNDALLAYSKRGVGEEDDPVLVVVNLDPWQRQGGWLELDLEALGLEPGHPFQAHDLLTEARTTWHGARTRIELDPQSVPAAIFRLRRRLRSERDFDYYL